MPSNADEERRRRRVARAERAERLAVEQLERGRDEIRRPCSARAAAARVLEAIEARDHEPVVVGRGRSFTVASTMTPSVPNEPMKSFGRS